MSFPQAPWDPRGRQGALCPYPSDRGEYCLVYINLFDLADLDAYPKVLEQQTKIVAVNKIDGWGAITRRLFSSVCREAASSDNEPLICSTNHGSTEVPYNR